MACPAALGQPHGQVRDEPGGRLGGADGGAHGVDDLALVEGRGDPIDPALAQGGDPLVQGGPEGGGHLGALVVEGDRRGGGHDGPQLAQRARPCRRPGRVAARSFHEARVITGSSCSAMARRGPG